MSVSYEPRQQVGLARHTSLKAGGSADWYEEPRDVVALREALEFARGRSLNVKLIGGGSNLLIADEGIAGLVVRPLFQSFTLEDEGEAALVHAAAGANLAGLARTLAKQGWSGLEWASNVPGCVGGAVVNNAGAFGSCVAETLVSARLMHDDFSIHSVGVDELGYRYRSSALKRGELPNSVVLEAAFRLRRESDGQALRKIRAFQDERTARQPRQLSAGSVFANPPGDYSGRLLEAAGAKGLRDGDAEISTQHANFIVNHGGATARQVYRVMTAAQQLVWQQFSVWLEPEIELAGRWTEQDRRAIEKPEGLR